MQPVLTELQCNSPRWMIDTWLQLQFHSNFAKSSFPRAVPLLPSWQLLFSSHCFDRPWHSPACMTRYCHRFCPSDIIARRSWHICPFARARVCVAVCLFVVNHLLKSFMHEIFVYTALVITVYDIYQWFYEPISLSAIHCWPPLAALQLYRPAAVWRC